jgi:predicted nucleic acid-binding protein
VVFDPKNKPVEEYQNLIDILQKAWARFLKKHIEVTYYPDALYIKMDFPV